MNRIRDINPKRLIVSAVLLLVLSVVLLLFARDVVREVFVIPISYLIWVIGIISRSTPQIFFWVILLVIAFLAAYRSLVGRRKVYAPPPPELMEYFYQTTPNAGRVSFWQIKVELLRMKSPYYRAGFHSSLSRLVIDLLAYRYRLMPAQVEERLEEGSLEVPPEVREYILSGMDRPIGDSRGSFARVWEQIIDTLRGWFSGKVLTTANAAQSIQTTPIDPRVARVLDYMKEELEVSHDYTGR